MENQAQNDLAVNRELLERYRRGETDALAVVFRAYAPEVAAMLRHGFSFESGGRRCRFRGARSQFDLEDFLHETFARAFAERARLSYDGITPFGAYLVRITRNLIIDDFRRKERALVNYAVVEDEIASSAPSASEPLSGQLGASGQPDLDAESSEFLHLVERFRSTLSARDEDVYQLRYVRELEHQDVTARTGLTDSKVKTSEKRIRLNFFAFMRSHGYFAGYEQETKRGWLRLLRTSED